MVGFSLLEGGLLCIDDFLPVLLRCCRPHCCLLDYLVISHLLKKEFTRYANERNLTTLSFSPSNAIFTLEHTLYDYFSLTINAEAEAVTKQLYTVTGTTGKEFGEVIEGVMTSGLMLDLLKGERRIQ